METIFSNINMKMSFPIDDAKLMKREFVNRDGQMEPLVSANVSSKMVIGAVLATTPPMPKLE